MADAEHIKQLKQGVAGWNKWRDESKEVQPDLSLANLNGLSLQGMNLAGTNLTEATLRHAYLDGVNLIGANLCSANLSEASLNGARLDGTKLREANLSGAKLRETNLSLANLSTANLSNANLNKAMLCFANLQRAFLIGTNLQQANLLEANLTQANLTQASLTQANLTQASFQETILAKIDLRTVKGLTTIQHRGPSHIEVFSVRLPQDGSALHFLRGAGVPDEWIDDYRIRMMHPIQYYSCFLSYTNKDEMIAKRLYADLQAEGVRCWFAPEDMKIGDRIRHRIDEAIHVQDKLLLILSEDALESEWIETEVETALEKERRQKRDVLFPVRLDESILDATQAWARHLRQKRHIGNFTKWETSQEYQVAFERLLRDLKQK